MAIEPVIQRRLVATLRDLITPLAAELQAAQQHPERIYLPGLPNEEVRAAVELMQQAGLHADGQRLAELFELLDAARNRQFLYLLSEAIDDDEEFERVYGPRPFRDKQIEDDAYLLMLGNATKVCRLLRDVLDAIAAPAGAEMETANPAMRRLVAVYTGGVADERLTLAAGVLAADGLTANEKLWKLDELIPLPATASARQLGEMLDCTNQAVQSTDWWKKNRRGAKAEVIHQREGALRKRANIASELERQDADDE